MYFESPCDTPVRPQQNVASLGTRLQRHSALSPSGGSRAREPFFSHASAAPHPVAPCRLGVEPLRLQQLDSGSDTSQGGQCLDPAATSGSGYS
eukprot:5528809-Heterocapsa_arctica.AAC.1